MRLSDLMHQVYDQHRLRAEKLNLELKLSLPGSKKETSIVTDTTKLQQIISNLLDNALKFTTEGKVELGYRVRQDSVSVFVSDTGKGIRKEEQGRIFDRFYQITDISENKPEGTGLGLAICKEYAGLIGAEISVKSRDGSGSMFSVRIPLKRKYKAKGRKSKH